MPHTLLLKSKLAWSKSTACGYSVLLIVSLFLVSTTPVFAQQGLIVRLDDDAPLALIEALEEEGHAKQAALFGQEIRSVRAVLNPPTQASKQALPFRAYTISLETEADVEETRQVWEGLEGIAYVQPNFTYQLESLEPIYNDPALDSLDHLTITRVFEAWESTTGSASTRIGFVDTGAFLAHPDLSSQWWINPGEDLNGNGIVDASDQNGIDDDGNGYIDDLRGYDFVDRHASVEPGDYFERDNDPSDDNLIQGGRGHGTLIAGVLGAALDNQVGIAGVAPGSRLVPLRAFGADGQGEDDDIVAAIVYAALEGIDVLNLSFGDTYYSPLMEEAIAFAVSRGTVVVASGGNLGGDDPHYPSDYSQVIGVAWLTRDGQSIAGRGAFGVGIDLGAPGSAVYTTTLPPPGADPSDADYLFGRRSGSSLAAPQVAGAAALLRSLDPSLSPASIQRILAESARDINQPGWDHQTAAGLLDVTQAIRRALPARVEIESPEHEEGMVPGQISIYGTVVHPTFESYELFFQAGNDISESNWQPLTPEQNEQRLDDELGIWDASLLSDGVYTLRLAVTLRSGKTIEDRRRVYLDASPPNLDFEVADVGLVDEFWGIIVEVETDDVSTLELVVTLDGQTFRSASDRQGRRHGLVWRDMSQRGGEARVAVRAKNVAGIVSEHLISLSIPPSRVNSALFELLPLSVPHGYLLPEATDFDRDGLLEITLNQYVGGWVGDSLATYEWIGNDFALAQGLVANVIPRSVGDANGDGLLELLTQVAGATLVLEQPTPQSGPTLVAFVDTTGLQNPFDPNAAFGSRIADLDKDGLGEYIVHNTREWRILEVANQQVQEVARLINPTAVSSSEISQNEFSEPQTLAGDFDGDGKHELVVGDNDGDWIIYEAEGDNQFRAIWTYETNRYNAGSRLAAGDFDGDGVLEWVGYTQNWTQTRSDNEEEAPLGIYYFWDAVAENNYALRYQLPIAGNLSRHGSMQSLDVDGDGKDELVIAHPPHLYVLEQTEEGLMLRFHLDSVLENVAFGVRSIAMTVGDFDLNQQQEVILGGADGLLYRLVPQRSNAAIPPPRWVEAYALNAQEVMLHWDAPGFDSTTVFQTNENGSLDPVATVQENRVELTRTTGYHFALQGWRQGSLTALSPHRWVRPHPRAILERVAYPTPRSVAITFSEPLDPSTQPHQFELVEGGLASALLLGNQNKTAILRFDSLSILHDQLLLHDVRDAEKTPVASAAVEVLFPAEGGTPLFINDWELINRYAVRLIFSAPLDETSATQIENYSLRPSGLISRIEWDALRPSEVELFVEGRPLGATGQETSLVVSGIVGLDGQEIGEEGSAIRLQVPADRLADAYIFPNPVRIGQQQFRVTIAGLPAEASIQILSNTGYLVRRLEEVDGDGGTPWDLRNQDGTLVPSGVYLVRIEAEGFEPVLRKVAVIH